MSGTGWNTEILEGYGRAMRVDVMTFPKPLAVMGSAAETAKRSGFDGMLLTEGGRTAFTAATAAALGAPGLELSTGVAVRLSPQSDDHRPKCLGGPRVGRRPIPPRAGHPGEDPRGPALRRPSSGTQDHDYVTMCVP